MASFLYLGAGFGMGVIHFLNFKKQSTSNLEKVDFPYVLAMIVLDIIAPILLMFGILKANSANAALLSNFEIVATAVIALVIFKEFISFRLWIGIILICVSSVILSVENAQNFAWSAKKREIYPAKLKFTLSQRLQ
ncbi:MULTISPECIES: EamA family transporter [unclassified Campylobacter]|uniref:EamA family transporter n=1 Tax=unclassified Campylobacter TaxID=2593542 RepID=UPI0022E9E0B4|nr:MULTISPECIES: EamA family transporter [unclassified Campylobacter]MDA3042943.1 DMT family transporter [Campylobacter sp. JMF_09 ED2]MDA3044222.1 DMT family transporter [Campylobacter sp. JMF_07 ED4]MDA3063571.1 DMT family transporter [Campylobacter sp. JMF_11 EL3]MDA3071197.1 DMT family transporter [Campylobacter sp. VBCF_03 NA9]MDA3074657.1 DMT family transporter [Campylobacter sp. JMF_05 ED3]